MRNQTLPSIKLLLALLVLSLAPACAWPSNNRSICLSKLMNVSLALHAYRKDHGSLPTDICDDSGHAILSWRVRILPFLDERHLHEEFHLNEPWDSPHNLELVRKTPGIYRCPLASADDGLTTYLRLLGSTQVLLVEVDEEHAVSWSKPGDLNYDPAVPSKGLARRHAGDFPARRGGFVTFAEGRPRLVPADSAPDALRELFSLEGEQAVSFE